MDPNKQSNHSFICRRSNSVAMEQWAINRLMPIGTDELMYECPFTFVLRFTFIQGARLVFRFI